MQFRLRTLMIALTIGPPILAILWANWEYLAKNRPGTSGFYIPANLNPLAEANLRRRLKLVRTLHSASGAATIVFYPAAVILQWIALRNWRNWRNPPKETKLTWIAFAAAMLLGASCLLFIYTHPSLWGMPPGNSLNNWKPL